MASTGRLMRLVRGRSLDDRRWRRHHRLLTAILALHVPVLAVVGAVTQSAVAPVLVPVAVIGVLLLMGALGRGRLVRTLAVALGLLSCSTALVFLTDGVTEAHFHYFLAIGLVAAYQDWRPYALAVVYVLSVHGVVGTLWPAWMYADPGTIRRPWFWAAVHGGFLLAAALLHLVAWKSTEREQRQAQRYHAQLYEGERAVVQRLREAEEAKDRLLAVASHELRTPLTAIVGLARTLALHHEELDRRRLADCVDGIEEHTARLSRVVDNLVAASGDETGEHGRAEIATVVGAVLDEFGDAVRFVLDVPRGVRVALDDVAARHVVRNLLDNGRKFAPPGTTVHVMVRPVGAEVEFAVTNVLRPGDEAAVRLLGDRLFDPFVQADSSDTRAADGLGLGLYVVRTVTAAHGGRVNLRLHGPRLTAVATLPAALDISLVDEGSPASTVRT